MSLKKFGNKFTKKKKNKYGAEKTIFEGRKYDSKMEAEFSALLNLKEKSGEIRDIEYQPKIYLTEARILYKPDFSFYRGEKKIYVDVKGAETAVFKLKKRLWASYIDAPLEIVKKKSSRFIITEIVARKDS